LHFIFTNDFIFHCFRSALGQPHHCDSSAEACFITPSY